MEAKGITQIYFIPTLGGSPARSHRYTGAVWIAEDMWGQMPLEHRFFVLLHEDAHIKFDTQDEFLADEYAFKEYARRGYSLSESIKALTRILKFDNPEHIKRAYNMLLTAQDYDYNINKNMNAYG